MCIRDSLLALLALPGNPPILTAQEAVLLQPDPVFFDGFGHAVAVDGDVAAVGIDQSGGGGPGAVYVFRRAAGSWAFEAKLTGSAPGGRFGAAVAVSGDALAVGDPAAGPLAPGSGAVHVFRRTGGVWVPEAVLAPLAGAANDAFGSSVTLDGDVLAAGAPFGDGAVADTGTAYAFRRAGGLWSQEAALSDPTGGPFEDYGRAVSVQGDTLLVGAPFDGKPANVAGSVFVYGNGPGGWTQEAVLQAQDGPANRELGIAVSLDGDTAAAGAHFDSEAGVQAGAVYVFTRSAGVWSQEAKLVPEDAGDNDEFGAAVSLSGDTLAVGSPGVDGAMFAVGSTCLYVRAGGAWNEAARLMVSGGASGDAFGWDVALDGEVLVASAPFEEQGFLVTGAAYAYRVEHPTLAAATCALSASAGGQQVLTLDAGAGHAGKPFLLLGTTSGTQPGTPVDALTLPLNLDAYLLFTLANPNVAPLAGSAGALDSAGKAGATFTLPPRSSPALVGLAVHHAYLVLGAGLAAELASNAVSVSIGF